MRKWRKMTWVLLAWVVLIVVWIATGVNSNSDNCSDEVGDARQLCEDATDVGTGIGVAIIFVIGFMGFIVLSLIWFMTRPKPQPQVQYVTATPTRDARPETRKAPPPVRSTKPAGWYRDPSGKFDWRWFDGGWTDDVANDGDDNSYTDPVPR